jgi:mRNA-degrading endonuclease RelE of RelBE toxin-antitoxin system
MIRVELLPRFRRAARKLPEDRQAEVAAALRALGDAFGDVHAHAGLGIRKLHGPWFECRAGLDLRVLFRAEAGVALCYTVGNHDHIARTLRGL